MCIETYRIEHSANRHGTLPELYQNDGSKNTFLFLIIAYHNIIYYTTI